MKRFLLMILMASLMWGCYPAGPEYTEDLDVIYTSYDKEYDFKASGGTYSMPDEVVIDAEKDDNGNWVPEYMAQPAADIILNAIEDKMTEYGWTRVDPEVEQPDVVVMPAAIKSTTYFYSYWYDWWYGGWYGGYWGWYYPPYVSISSYTTGSLVIVMSDPSLAEDSPIGQSPTNWVAIGNGLYTGYYDAGRVTDAIDQAFAQSPYLYIN
jgi:hypothetical protein